MSLRFVQESRHPVGKDIDSRARVVHIGKDVTGLAIASIVKGFLVPGSSAMWSATPFCGDSPGDSLYGDAVDQNKDQSNDIHSHECTNDGILCIEVRLTPLRHSNQHPTDAELNWNDGSTVADFKYEKELVDSSVLCQSMWPKLRSPSSPPPSTFHYQALPVSNYGRQFH